MKTERADTFKIKMPSVNGQKFHILWRLPRWSFFGKLLPTMRRDDKDFPGIGFRQTYCREEAYIEGTRLAVWELVDLHREVDSVEKTAEHFGFSVETVRGALAYAAAFPDEIAAEKESEVGGLL